MNNKNLQINEQTSTVISDVLQQIGDVSLYEKSIHEIDGVVCFIVRKGIAKYLVVAGDPETNLDDFTGQPISSDSIKSKLCELTQDNAHAIRARFEFTNPVLIGKSDSYGLGDRLGNAGAAHLRAIRRSDFKPVLAQQSIRELERTGRTAREVMDAATWAVFQEGYHDGFGADGDHLKTARDIDLMVEAGYTMFTIDPSEYVVNGVKSMDEEELRKEYEALPWEELMDSPDTMLKRLLDLDIQLEGEYRMKPAREEILQGMVKYGGVINHTKKMADYISDTYPDHPAELELSVDETDEPTTLFEHYLVAGELNRLGVDLVSLAPRFCGDFEKGIDFKGDMDQFRREYIQHLAIAAMFGGYKLSIHSGSDKFSVYGVIGSINEGNVHVKTAGTSYLEALRTIAEADPDLFREILIFSMKRFQTDKKTYHISADPNRIPDPELLTAVELKGLLDDDDARQVLHVAFGSVLSGTLPEAGEFKKRLMNSLEENEELHEYNLVRHFERHLNPFS